MDVPEQIEMVSIDWKKHVITYRDRIGIQTEVMFPDENPSFDYFRSACIVGIAQRTASDHLKPSLWRGATHSFLCQVFQELGWQCSVSSQITYWSHLCNWEKKTRAEWAWIIDSNGRRQGHAKPVFGRVRNQGYVLGQPVKRSSAHDYCIPPVTIINPDADYEILRGVVKRILAPDTIVQDPVCAIGRNNNAAADHADEDRKEVAAGSAVLQHGTGVLLPSMADALNEMRDAGVRRIRLLSYVGNFLHRSLSWHWPPPQLDGLDIRVLLRNPDGSWSHPPQGTEQHKKRTGQIRSNIEEFKTRNEFRGMCHRIAATSAESFCYFLSSEPSVHVALGEDRHGSRRMYFGFYALQPRGLEGQEILDFSASRRPVLRVVADSPESKEFIKDFVDWFDFIWDLRAEEGKVAILDRSPHSKKVLAVDFDGVVADTNRMKADWIRRNLGREVLPGNCDRTQCTKLISKEAYNRMAAEVYSRQSTGMTPELAGAVQTLRKLSRTWQIVVITARSCEDTVWAEKWLTDHDLLGFCIKCVLPMNRFRKLDIAARLGATALIDDDLRHLILNDHPDILRIHLSSGDMTVPKGASVSRATSWQQVEKILSKKAKTVGRHPKPSQR